MTTMTMTMIIMIQIACVLFLSPSSFTISLFFWKHHQWILTTITMTATMMAITLMKFCPWYSNYAPSIGMVKFDRHYIFYQNEDRDDNNRPRYQAPVDLLLGCSELAARSREGNTGKTALMWFFWAILAGTIIRQHCRLNICSNTIQGITQATQWVTNITNVCILLLKSFITSELRVCCVLISFSPEIYPQCFHFCWSLVQALPFPPVDLFLFLRE